MFNNRHLYARENGALPDTGMIEVIPNNQPSGISTLPATLPNGTAVPSTPITTLPANVPGWVNNPSGNNFPPMFPPNMVANVLGLCMNNLMYISTRNGESFWYYPTDIYQINVNGYRWNQQAGWFSYSIPFTMIQNAYCYNP